jgi:hypothetical protein
MIGSLYIWRIFVQSLSSALDGVQWFYMGGALHGVERGIQGVGSHVYHYLLSLSELLDEGD